LGQSGQSVWLVRVNQSGHSVGSITESGHWGQSSQPGQSVGSISLVNQPGQSVGSISRVNQSGQSVGSVSRVSQLGQSGQVSRDRAVRSVSVTDIHISQLLTVTLAESNKWLGVLLTDSVRLTDRNTSDSDTDNDSKSNA